LVFHYASPWFFREDESSALIADIENDFELGAIEKNQLEAILDVVKNFGIKRGSLRLIRIKQSLTVNRRQRTRALQYAIQCNKGGITTPNPMGFSRF